MHLFHRWEEETRSTAEVEEYIFGRRTGDSEVMLIIERCTKCAKRRAYILQIGMREKVDVRLADHLLALRAKR